MTLLGKKVDIKAKGDCIFKLDTIIQTLHKAILLTFFDIFWGDMVEI